MSFRLGFIGAGGIAEHHATAAAAVGVEIAGFCDMDARRAAERAAAHPGALGTASLDELLELPDLRAVVVAAPNRVHRECAVRALDAGKDVLLEKPMAMSVAECDEIIAAARRSGGILQMGFVSRCSPVAREAERLVRAGRFGRIYHARGQWYRQRGIPGLGGWFTTKAESGGGVLIDLGVHLIDLVMHLAGRPRPLRASGACTGLFGAPIETYTCYDMWGGPRRPGGTFDVEDGANGFLRFEGGLTAEIAVAWASNLPEERMANGITLLGEKGGCQFDTWGRTLRISREDDGRLVEVEVKVPPAEPWAEAFRAQHERFAEAVTRRTPPTATAEEGREVQAILDALYRSSDAGREVEI